MDFLSEYVAYATERSAGDQALKLALLSLLIETYRGKGQVLEDFSNWQIAERKSEEKN